MIGFNGGLIGGFRDTRNETASVPGVWTANEQVVARRRGAWLFLDPFFSNVSLLLPGDGTNGSTSIIDRSPSPKTVTAFGNAQISTAQSKFGGSSLAFDGSGDYLTLPSNAGFAMGASDFTWEAWIYFNSGTTYRQIFSTRPGGTNSTTAGSLSVNPSQGLTWWTTGFIVHHTSSIGINQWNHVAVCRQGSTIRVFSGGTILGSAANTDNLTNSILSIGANNDGSEPFNGFIDDLRITKGVARYTTNFTPPTAPHPFT